MKNFLMGVLMFVLICSFIYGCWWVVKTCSYTIFYENMVEDTIRDMVEPEYLK